MNLRQSNRVSENKKKAAPGAPASEVFLDAGAIWAAFFCASFIICYRINPYYRELQLEDNLFNFIKQLIVFR